MMPLPPPALLRPASPSGPLRAQYSWGYLGADGEGRGTLVVLLEPTSGRVVLELHGVGERLVFLEGDSAQGYHLLIPRRKVDDRAAGLGDLDLPFLPQVGSVAALCRLLSEGEGPGVKVSKRDAQGPVKLRYEGKDDRGKAVKVWLTRERWEPAS